MIDQRKRHCRRCSVPTLHNRIRWEGLWGFQMFFILGSFWVCLPLVIPIALLVRGIDLVRPYHCGDCGRRKWIRGASDS